MRWWDTWVGFTAWYFAVAAVVLVGGDELLKLWRWVRGRG